MSFSYTDHERFESLERRIRELEAQVSLLMDLVRERASQPSYVTPTSSALFDVVLVSYPMNQKIMAIKIIREVTGLGLKEAKDLSEALPARIKSGVTPQEAERIERAFAEINAHVSRG